MKLFYYILLTILGFLCLGLIGCSNEDAPDIPDNTESVLNLGDLSYLPKVESGETNAYYKYAGNVDSLNGEVFVLYSDLYENLSKPEQYDYPQGVLFENGNVYFNVFSDSYSGVSIMGDKVMRTGDLILRELARSLYTDFGKRFSFLFPAPWYNNSHSKSLSIDFPCHYTRNRHQIFDISSCTEDNLTLLRNYFYEETTDLVNSYVWYKSDNPDALNFYEPIKVEDPTTYFHTIVDALLNYYGDIYEFPDFYVNLQLMRQAFDADCEFGPNREHWKNVVTPEYVFDYPPALEGTANISFYGIGYHF